MTLERDYEVTLSDDTTVFVRLSKAGDDFEIVTFSDEKHNPIDLDEEQASEAEELAVTKADEDDWPEEEEEQEEEEEEEKGAA